MNAKQADLLAQDLNAALLAIEAKHNVKLAVREARLLATVQGLKTPITIEVATVSGEGWIESNIRSNWFIACENKTNILELEDLGAGMRVDGQNYFIEGWSNQAYRKPVIARSTAEGTLHRFSVEQAEVGLEDFGK